MGHDNDAKEMAEDGCPKCGGSLNKTGKDRVPGGFDWYHYECQDCGNEVTY